MSVKFRSVSTATNTDGVDATSVIVTKPAEVSDGDVLVAVTHGYTSDSFTPPAGWVLLGVFDDSTGLRSRAYRKIASSEPANYTFTFGGGGGAIGVSVTAFISGHDILAWDAKVTSTQVTGVGNDLDAARDAIGFQVYTWRNATANATVTWDEYDEKHDVTAKATGASWRGQSGSYYGPPEFDDIINAGDLFPSDGATPSTSPTHGIIWTFLIGEVEPDTEPWTSTDGEFAVEVRMDRDDITTTGDITTPFRRDVTGRVSSITASNSGGGAAANAADGLRDTFWQANTATAWLQYDFGANNAQTVKRYRLTSSTSASRDPMDFTLQGSNNGSSFTTIDTRTNVGIGNRLQAREFKVASPGSYRYYRLDVTANKSSGAVSDVRLAEMRLSTVSTWEDVTSFVQENEKIRITRGLQGTSGRSDFSRAYLTFDNTDGRFSIRNQDGAYYGALQRNSEMRISKAYGTKTLQLGGSVRIEGTDVVGDGVRTILTDALAVTGDIDIRVDVDLLSWRGEQMLCGVAVAPGAHSWTLHLDGEGRLVFAWTPSGGSTVTATSTTAVPQATRQAVRVTLDVNNGAGGNTVTFYTAPTIAGSFTQLGSTVVNTGTTSIGYAGGGLCVGHVASEPQRGLHGRVYHFELRTGISGTLVSDVDFTSITNGAHAFTETSNNWVTTGSAVISNRRYRFHGEVAEWPIAWDPTSTWVYVSATAAGIQKRLERGSATGSVMYRHHTKGLIIDPTFDFQRNATLAYWPMEDAKNSFQLASAIPSRPHLEIYGNPTLAEYDEFQESSPILKLNQSKLGGRVTEVPEGTAEINFLFSSPGAITVGAHIISLFTTGSLTRWDILYQAANTWRVNAYSESGVETGGITTTLTGISMTTVGELMHVRINLLQEGAIAGIVIDAVNTAGEDLGGVNGGFLGETIGTLFRVEINNHDTIRLNEVYVGHLAVYGERFPEYTNPVNAWHYETGANRIDRICDEEDIEFRLIGDADRSTFMGYQSPDSSQSVMSTAAVSDNGYLTDPLDAFGVQYRTGRSLFNQAARLTFSYTGNELSGELRPVPDDSYLTNDFTARRGGAGSARYRLERGKLSVQLPPEGVGEYADDQSYSLAHEGQCVDLASWFVHQGTLDEEHYNRVEIALENLRIAADPALIEAILVTDIGMRMDITDTPDFLPADDIRQIIVGYEEWFDNFQHDFKLNTIPERAFETAQYDTDYRFDIEDSTIYADISASATSMQVSVNSGQPWSLTASDFDVWVDGERMTVTAVANDTTNDKSDTFNRADSATNLGSTNGGVVEAWVQDLGTWGINSNTAYVSVAGNSIATLSGTSDFEELAVTVSTWPSGEAWLNFRFSDTNNRLRFGGTVGSAATFEVVSGGVVTRSDMTDSTYFTLADDDRLSVRTNGSVIEMFINGELALCVTESTNIAGTRVGMQTQSTAVRFNNFSYDYAISPQTLTVTRGVNGVSAPHVSGTEVTLYQRPYRAL